ncbi:TnsD family Tn7-like transposition protein [Alteromonas sp. ASW11-130]|uniref:TnsD family Tn7-like transposition protein n=1 Tax=Alteromonas sp. ASW11-130 TaxID=3015775 RepID=UPI002241C4C7|nr:TnsD family Tn7-like transposition protein [Alteromonas sp. ASW11-130]MCW8093207.1 TnsD family transposase [Alteromonas sp. ASW11-130]
MSRNWGIVVTLPFFPQLYPNELFYSALARYKVRCGILPDKLLAKDVFQVRTVIASAEVPNCISVAHTNILPDLSISAEELVLKHTLYSLYAAFSDQRIKRKILKQMLNTGANTYTTSLGLATCVLRKNNFFRFCPLCVLEQINTYGEMFWDRRWFGVYTNCCPMHGITLHETDIAIHNPARHAYIPLIDVIHSIDSNTATIRRASVQDGLVAKAAMNILENLDWPTLTLDQLTLFYRGLAIDRQYNRGQYICQAEVANFIQRFWSWRWLESCGFNKKTFDQAMAALFRKHRKQQTYLIHLVGALPFFDGDINSWINAVVSLPPTQRLLATPSTHGSSQEDRAKLAKWKNAWLAMVKSDGPKQARTNTTDGKKLYAALYRADKYWLLDTNSKYRVDRTSKNDRVNWGKRDHVTCKALFACLYLTNDVSSERRSKRWFMLQLNNSATIEHNLYRLPLTARFLERYSESVEDYQCRRLTQATAFFAKQNIRAQPWQLYRRARINTQRQISSMVCKTCEWCVDWLAQNIK